MSEEITQLVESQSTKQPSNVIPSDISKEMQKAYLDYAMSVIVSRALPDVRDGLKPVQRRIIYAMQDQSMLSSGKFHKCAAVVGEVLKKYHPHGDSAVYEALVRMGQDFTLRYPLIAPQGNFGSIDDDPPAAMRYTECKLSKITEELYTDIDKETVPFELNDLQNYEPSYLPSLLPNLLLNGASGIAVGMATNIPPHNLGEVIDGLDFLIQKATATGSAATEGDTQSFEVFGGKIPSIKAKVAKVAFTSGATVEELTQYIRGPDFPTGGIIYDQKEITQMYATGKGRAVTRAKMETEESKGDKVKIIVTEIPYQINKAALISRIADLVKNKKIEGISDLRDESNKQGIRVVIELKRDAVLKKVQNQLYKHTPLQTTFNANLVALINNEPKLMTLKMILEEFVKHRQLIIVKRTIFLLRRAREREHILQGLKTAIDNIDNVIKIIRGSKDADTAKNELIAKLKLTEIQAQAILDMQLRKLAALERQKIDDELKQILSAIGGYEKLVSSPEKIIETVKKELLDIRSKYADERKTKVVKSKVGELTEEDLVVEEPCIITISGSGYIKRLKEDTYRRQGRGGKGVTGQQLKEEDTVSMIKSCSTHDWALFFTDTGKVYKLRVWEIPETLRAAKGTPLINFLSIGQEEKLEAFLTLDNALIENENSYIFLATRDGVVKKTSLTDFANIRTSGILAIRLGPDDKLIFAGITNGNDEVMLTTTFGQSIRFNEKTVRSMGRSAGGVTGIKLTKQENDFVVGTAIIPINSKNLELLTVSEGGYGKKTPTSGYKTQNRGGSGILTYRVTEKTGRLITAKLVNSTKVMDALVATQSGKVLRLSVKQIPSLNRNTLGVRLIKLGKSDKVTSIAVLEEELPPTGEPAT